MEDIIEFFGTGLLAMVAAAGFIKIYMTFLVSDGVLYLAVSSFMKGICG